MHLRGVVFFAAGFGAVTFAVVFFAAFFFAAGFTGFAGAGGGGVAGVAAWAAISESGILVLSECNEADDQKDGSADASD